MAGKPQPAPRRAPPSSTQADGLTAASRDAVASDWGVTPPKTGVRGEVKLALLLILTLVGAFGYIVHRKFQVLRNEVVAAEGSQFRPLKSADPRAEISLPPADAPDPESPGSDPNWAAYDLSQQAANEVPPVLAVTSTAPQTASGESDPFPTSQSVGNPSGGGEAAGSPPTQAAIQPDEQLPFPASLAQSEPGFSDGPNRGSPSLQSTTVSTSDDPFPAATVESSVIERTPQPPFSTESPSADAAAPPPRVAVADAIPFATESIPSAPNENRDGEVPLDLFGELPSTSVEPSNSEPTFTAEAPGFASSREPAQAEPAFFPPTNAAAPAAAPPSFRPLTGVDPVDDSESTPASQPIADSPAMIQPTLEPAPLEAETSPPLLTGPATLGSSPEAFPPLSDPQSEPAFTPLEPRFADTPAPAPAVQSGDAVPWNGPRAVDTPQLARDPFPSPAAPATTLEQPIPVTPGPSFSPEPTLSRTPEPASPVFPDSQPLPVQTLPERSLFDDPPVTAAREPTPSPLTTLPRKAETLYTVRPGDNYWTIAKSEYGSVRYFAALTEFNRSRVPDPQKMRPGMQVAIPDAAVLETQYPQLFAGQMPSATATQPTPRTDGPGQFFVSAGEPHYRVGEGDTLSSIAQKHLGRASRWEQVYTMNREVLPDANRLKPGTVIRLPRDASQISVTPGGR